MGVGGGLPRPRRPMRQKAKPTAAITPRGTPTPIPIFADFVRPVDGGGVAEGVVVGDEVVAGDGDVASDEIDVGDRVDVISIVTRDGVANVFAGGRDVASDETDVGVIDDTVVAEFAVMLDECDAEVRLEETDAEIEPPTTAARLMPFLSLQQVVLVLPQHHVPSLHCVSPILADAP